MRLNDKPSPLLLPQAGRGTCIVAGKSSGVRGSTTLLQVGLILPNQWHLDGLCQLSRRQAQHLSSSCWEMQPQLSPMPTESHRTFRFRCPTFSPEWLRCRSCPTRPRAYLSCKMRRPAVLTKRWQAPLRRNRGLGQAGTRSLHTSTM
jgi:hypothetical protein